MVDTLQGMSETELHLYINKDLLACFLLMMMELDQTQALFNTPHPPPATYTDRCRLPLFLIKNLKVDCIYYTFMVIG